MICHQMQRLIFHSPQLCIQSFANNIQRFKIGSTRDIVGLHRHELSLRWRYYSSQHSIIQREINNGTIALRCAQKNDEFKFHRALVARNSGIFGKSSRILPMYQSRRFIGDSAAATTAAAVIASNSPMGQYYVFLRLLYDNPVIEYVQNSLLSLHSYTGLPWWADIVLVTIAARTFVTLPLALYQESNRAKLANVNVELEDHARGLKAKANRAVSTGKLTVDGARSQYNQNLKKEWQELIIRDNCHPAKSVIVIFAQFPMWLCLSASLRNLCFMFPQPTIAAYETYMQLSTGGFGWISNLAAVDSYWILPIALGFLNLANIEFAFLLHQRETTKLTKIILNISRGLSFVLVPIAAITPSCISLYWVTSSACGIMQHIIVASPRVRQYVGIPESPLVSEHPYQDVRNNFKEKYGWMKSKKVRA